MRRARLTRPHLPVVPFPPASRPYYRDCALRLSEKEPTALVRPFNPSNTVPKSIIAPIQQSGKFVLSSSKYKLVRQFSYLLRSSKWKPEGSLGQGFSFRASNSTIERNLDAARLSEHTVLEEFQLAFRSDNSDSWNNCALSVRRNHGYEGVWELFRFIQTNGLLRVLANHDTQVLRDEILTAGLHLDSRLSVIVNSAHELLNDTKLRWPDLYMKIVYHMLDHEQHDRSIRWHHQLVPRFSPSKEVFGALISSFVVDPSPNMQSNLAALYVACADKQLYDDIIPVLFAAGRSKLARAWRKKLLAYQDFPRTSKSKPFVQFLARFYPTILLTPEELEIGGLMSNSFDAQNSRPKNTETEVNKGQFSDAIVARWFASTWTSVEFAIQLAQTLGLRTIGPRSLQSLALRESDSRTVASRVAQIEKLDIAISNQVYCKALVHFAKHEKDALLTSLLSCDVHPDEFEDIETRQMLMASSVREQDWQMERLLQGIEWAIEHDPVARKLHALLDRELLKRKLDNARQVVQRMEALKVNMSQESALQLLEGAFLGLGKHPAGKIRQTKESSRHDFEALLSRALDVTRRVALHDVAIPLRFWSLLFYNLGRLGRFAELEQLSLEVVQLYTPPLGGLIPIYAADLPQSDINTGNEGDTIRCRFAPPIAEKISRHNCSSQHDPSQHDQSWSNVRRCVEVPTPRQSDDEEALPVNRKLASGSESVVKDQRADRSIERELDLALAKENSKEYIPADLPFSHRKHPVQRLFDAHLQRSIVRWGFDQTLKTKPNAIALVDPPTFNVSSFDVASGVRLLALLRDQGVLIDPHILRTTIVTRIALGHMPSRQRDRSRDRHELSVEYMKALFDEAWGFEILPSPPEISRQIESQKPRLWGRYFNLFGQSFDKG